MAAGRWVDRRALGVPCRTEPRVVSSRGWPRTYRSELMTARKSVLPVTACLLLTACATVPTGPSILVLPGTGKSFEQFQADDAVCRQWAMQQTGTTPNQAGATSAVTGAAVGTVV